MQEQLNHSRQPVCYTCRAAPLCRGKRKSRTRRLRMANRDFLALFAANPSRSLDRSVRLVARAAWVSLGESGPRR